MDGLFWLGEGQLERIKPFFAKSRGVSRVDDRKLFSGILYVLHHGRRWVAAGSPWTVQKSLQPLPPLVREGWIPVDLL